jgi:hypothetical protein
MSLFNIAIFICLLLKLYALDSNSYFVNNSTLVGPDQYLLYWNYTSTEIIFKTVVKTNGWLGFGISPNGEMAYSDLIVAYMNQNGTVNFTNRYVESSSILPIINKKQFWSMLFYTQKNGYTTAIFKRKLVICNVTNSIDIEPGTQYTIFAWGDSFSKTKNYTDIKYHSSVNRSSASLPLISSLNANVKLNMTQIETFDLNINVKAHLFIIVLLNYLILGLFEKVNFRLA